MYCHIDGISDHEAVLTKSLIQAESCPTTEDIFICGPKLTSTILGNQFNPFVKSLSLPLWLLLLLALYEIGFLRFAITA